MPCSIWRGQAPLCPLPHAGQPQGQGDPSLHPCLCLLLPKLPALPLPWAEQSRAASWGWARELCWLLAVPGASCRARLPNRCPARWRELRGRAELCLLHPRPRASMPAGPGHSGQQHVPVAVTLLSLPAESSPALPWWRCSLQLPAGEARGGRRRCGLLRLGHVSKSSGHGSSSLRGRPGTPRLPGSAWLGSVCSLPAALLGTGLPMPQAAVRWGALVLLTSCVQRSRAGVVLPSPSALPSPGQDTVVAAELRGQPGAGSSVHGVVCSSCAGAAAGPCRCHPGRHGAGGERRWCQQSHCEGLDPAVLPGPDRGTQTVLSPPAAPGVAWSPPGTAPAAFGTE